MLNGLDLFSGIGGISIALKQWVRPIAYCEIDPYCQGVLLSRMSDGRIPYAPIWDNVTTLQGLPFRGHIDIIYGGFPCQDISIAGNGKGLAGERSGLFFEIMRLAKEIKPKFIFLENVPAITSRGGWECLHTISALGYDCRWCVISAASVGALHLRERWFLLAFSSSKSSNLQMADPMRQRLENGKEKRQSEITKVSTLGSDWNKERIRLWQETVSSMDRTSNGIPNQVDRIKSLGNSVVPCQAKEAFKILMGLTHTSR